MALDAIHASTLYGLMRCGIAYQRRTLNREGQPPTTPQIRGSAVHRGVGAGLLLHQHQGTPAPVELFEDVAASEIDRARHGGATFTQEEAATGIARTWGALKDEVVRYAGSYGRLIAPTITPVAVERRVTVADVVPGVLLRGTIDLIDRVQGVDIVRDEKTSARAPREDAADRSQQLTMYDVLHTAATGDHGGTHPVSLDYMVFKESTRTITHTRLASVRGPRDRRALVLRAEAAVAMVKAGTFLPANPETDWFCSEKFCEFWSTCPYAYGPSKRS